MSRISGFITVGDFVAQGSYDIEAAGGGSKLYSGNTANAAFVRFKKHASQTGGAVPIAYLSYNPSDTTPDATCIPIYDGDSFWIWPEEIKAVSVASADANQPTVHYVLRYIS